MSTKIYITTIQKRKAKTTEAYIMYLLTFVSVALDNDTFLFYRLTILHDNLVITVWLKFSSSAYAYEAYVGNYLRRFILYVLYILISF